MKKIITRTRYAGAAWLRLTSALARWVLTGRAAGAITFGGDPAAFIVWSKPTPDAPTTVTWVPRTRTPVFVKPRDDEHEPN